MKKKLGLILFALIAVISIFALSACGKNDRDDDDDDEEACKHKFGEWVEEIHATCTSDGKIGYYQCSKCDEYFDENKKELKSLVIPASHSFGEWIAEVPATCTEDGALGHYTCSVCNKNFDSNKNELSSLVITSEGHNFVDDVCTKCDFELVYSKGLAYELVNGEYYKVVGIGTCMDKELNIPRTYNNIPVKEIAAESLAGNTFTSVVIPDSIINIGEYSFADNVIESLIIPSSVESIGEGAFLKSSSLTEVQISNGVKYIGSAAFCECDALENILIPESVLFIGDGAFSYSEKLTNIIVSDKNENYVSVDGDLYTKDGKLLLQYAIGKTDNSFIVPNEVLFIDANAFACSLNLTSIIMPNGLTSIDGGTFIHCENLVSVIIPRSITIIGDSAFRFCDNLTEIYYTGTQDEWNKIDVASSGNDALISATIHYNYRSE